MSEMPSYVMLTDSPPLENGGYGLNVVTWNWCVAMGKNLKLIVTRLPDPTVRPTDFTQSLQTKVVFYSDLRRIVCGRRVASFKSIAVLIRFIFSLGRIKGEILSSGATRLFSFIGGDGWFLLMTALVAWKTKLPLDVYLVDDLEESARNEKHPIFARFVRWFEPRVLRRADRVFLISKGYVDHVRKKYSVQSQWLPIPFGAEKVQYHSSDTANERVRQLAYLGSVNHLYESALRELLEAMKQWNSESRAFKLELVIMSHTDSEYVKHALEGLGAWTLLSNRSDAECMERLSRSWAIFLPYSFEEDQRVMVSTSFPSRLARCMVAGRPLFVYGPGYASLPRYFAENDLLVCVQSCGQLIRGLEQIDAADCPQTIERYENILKKNHSASAICGCLEMKEKE